MRLAHEKKLMMKVKTSKLYTQANKLYIYTYIFVLVYIICIIIMFMSNRHLWDFFLYESTNMLLSAKQNLFSAFLICILNKNETKIFSNAMLDFYDELNVPAAFI